jgi:ribosomal protein L16/L10AE
MIEPYATVDDAVDDMANQYWKNITVSMINRDIDLLYDSAISLKALEEARVSVKKKLKKYRKLK